MPLHPPRRKRRLRGHDYTAPGAYYITLRARRAIPPFGQSADGALVLTEIGRAVEKAWRWLSTQYAYVVLDDYAVMPDHLHGILRLLPDKATATADASTTTAVVVEKRKTVGSLIGAFKTVSTNEMNRILGVSGRKVWQRDFYDHVIGDAHDLDRIRRYIRANPERLNSPDG